MIAGIIVRFKALVFRRRADDELDEEMRYHLERDVERNIANGMTPADARFAARRAFGNVAVMTDNARDAMRWRWLEEAAPGHSLHASHRSPSADVCARRRCDDRTWARIAGRRVHRIQRLRATAARRARCGPALRSARLRRRRDPSVLVAARPRASRAPRPRGRCIRVLVLRIADTRRRGARPTRLGELLRDARRPAGARPNIRRGRRRATTRRRRHRAQSPALAGCVRWRLERDRAAHHDEWCFARGDRCGARGIRRADQRTDRFLGSTHGVGPIRQW